MTNISCSIHKKISSSVIYSLIASCIFLPADLSNAQISVTGTNMAFVVLLARNVTVKRATNYWKGKT
jgi:hypothetical protein